MQILLHIGMHKTGSTAIQQAMARYDDGDTIFARLGEANHSTMFHSAFSSSYLQHHVFDRKGYSVEKREELHRSSIAKITGFLRKTERRRVIFSGEGIVGLNEADLKNMLAILGDFSDDIQALAYVRDPVGYAKSNIQEVIKNGGANLKRAMQPRYRLRLEKFSDLLGRDNVQLHSFDRSNLLNGDVIDDFADKLGLDRHKLGNSVANSSISFEAQQCVFLLNRVGLLTFGDPALNNTRRRFIKAMDRILPKTSGPDDASYVPYLDLEDMKWMGQSLGRPFELPDPPENPVALDDIYTSLPESSVETLLSILRDHGISNDFRKDPSKLVCRIFYLCHLERPRLSFSKRSSYGLFDSETVSGLMSRFFGVRSFF